jgi:hypothetical protein
MEDNLNKQKNGRQTQAQFISVAILVIIPLPTIATDQD